MCEKYYIWNLAACSCENGKCAESIIDDSVITCDEIIEERKTIPTKTLQQKPCQQILTKKKVACKTKNFYILLTF